MEEIDNIISSNLLEFIFALIIFASSEIYIWKKLYYDLRGTLYLNDTFIKLNNERYDITNEYIKSKKDFLYVLNLLIFILIICFSIRFNIYWLNIYEVIIILVSQYIIHKFKEILFIHVSTKYISIEKMYVYKNPEALKNDLTQKGQPLNKYECNNLNKYYKTYIFKTPEECAILDRGDSLSNEQSTEKYKHVIFDNNGKTEYFAYNRETIKDTSNPKNITYINITMNSNIDILGTTIIGKPFNKKMTNKDFENKYFNKYK